MQELNLYKIPSPDTQTQDTNNPANLSSGGAAIDNSTFNPKSGGLNEQQVRDIVNSMRSNGMTEDKVRAIVNSMQKFLEGENIMMTGIQKSQNFYTGVSGWQIDAEGNAEFNDGTFRGRFDIGGTTITIDNTEDIQENLDTIEAAGGGTLFLQNGTYTLTADISIPAGTVLQGVSRDGVIIDCDTSYKVNIIGSNAYTTGTLAISDGDTTVVGTGTTFTSGMVGRFIMLSGLWYEIITFTDTTHIEISPAYSGTNLSGYGVVIADVNFASTIRKLTIINGTTGLKVQYAQEYFLDDIIIYDCTTGVDIDDSVFGRHLMSAVDCGVNFNANNMWGFKIDFSEFSNSLSGAGVVMTSSGSGTVFDSAGYDNFGNFLSLTSCSNIAFISVANGGNGAAGAECISGCNDLQFIAFTCDGNTTDGIKFTATSDRNTIVSSSIINNGGYGINIAAATCDNNQVIAPAFDNNTSGNINDSGTGTFISPQEVGSNVQTFTSSGTWTKPSSGTMALIQCWGGGGSGGKTAGSGFSSAGGGGGSYIESFIPLSSLGSTETVTIGAGGASRTTEGTGNIGGNTTFGSHLTAYGGAGGEGANSASGGGGGGGISSVGTAGSGGGSGGAGGSIQGGAGGAVGVAGGTSNFGGGAGGGGNNGGAIGGAGGASVYGGGGGGGDGRGNGGAVGGTSVYGGGGGGGGAIDGTPGGGAGGVSVFGGAGGAGAFDASNATAGTQPAGGGGGCEEGNSGAGGAGKIIVTTF